MSQLLFRDYSKDEIRAIELECGVKSVFTQNAKMKRSSSNGIHLYNWGIPAFKSKLGLKTCPNASKCATGCYATMGAYIWSNVNAAYEARLNLSRTKGFEQVITYHIDKLLKRHIDGTLMIRIHDSGDFYSESYYESWNSISKAFIHEPRVQLYAYTKMVSLGKTKTETRSPNFSLIYSLGGTEDKLINPAVDRHSKVFENEIDLRYEGYSNASHNDLIALGPNNKVGLIYHGNKSYKNTTWNKVGSK